MTMPFLQRSLQPFERLQISDGLLITAKRWQQAHSYHCQRQNLLHQSVHSPGIVWGLGVSVIRAPETISSQYRDGRWVQIQPGLAIDNFGNPIVVPAPIEFRIASEASAKQPVEVFLMLRYVDPDKLQALPEQETIQETFRIDETVTLPQVDEIELCRICLAPGRHQLKPAANVMFPGLNELDLRFRPAAHVRQTEWVEVGCFSASATAQFRALLQSAIALYPKMAGRVEHLAFPLNSSVTKYHLLYLTKAQFLALDEASMRGLLSAIAQGTTIIVAESLKGSAIAELQTVRQQLTDALLETSESEETYLAVQCELSAVTEQLQEYLQQQHAELSFHCHQLGIAISQAELLSSRHPLKTEPFLFSQFPTLRQQPITLLNSQGLIHLLGDLSVAWDGEVPFSREAVRTSQELGINVLHFAWQRKQRTTLQASTAAPEQSSQFVQTYA